MNIYIAGTCQRQYLYADILGRRERQVENAQRDNRGQNDCLSCRRTPGKERQGSREQGGQGYYILESYFACRDNKWITQLFPELGGLLLDSGAFTWLNGSKQKIDFDRYTEEYAEYVKAHGIKNYIEMDVDSVIGLKEVERLRAKLERLVGWQPIPVWHISRGKDYFVQMCKDYPYVAFGGIQTDGVSRTAIERAFPWFINTAHEHGTKIHGLGYTCSGNLRKFHFDSVDSTAWLYGNRGGYIYRFNPTKQSFFERIDVPQGKRLNPHLSAQHNFMEWIKFQQYALKNL